MGSTDPKSRRRAFERTVELELEPLELGDKIGLRLIFASLCVMACGGVLFYGSAWLHVHGRTGYTGIALILAGGTKGLGPAFPWQPASRRGSRPS